MSELVPHDAFPDVTTGEMLPATPANAHRVLMAVKEMEAKLRMVKSAVTEYVIEESKVQGTKTFNVGGGQVTLTGGPSTEIDAQTLAQLLREEGCPEERINEVVTEEISYKVNRNVLRQLTGSNPDYKAAADLATHEIQKDYPSEREMSSDAKLDGLMILYREAIAVRDKAIVAAGNATRTPDAADEQLIEVETQIARRMDEMKAEARVAVRREQGGKP